MAGQQLNPGTPCQGLSGWARLDRKARAAQAVSCLLQLRIMSNTSSFPFCAMRAVQMTGMCFSWYQPALTRAWLCWRSCFLDVPDAET